MRVDANLLHRAGPALRRRRARSCATWSPRRAAAGRSARALAYNSMCVVAHRGHAVSMSKAFTREEDEAAEDDAPDEAPPLPAGARNYMTPGGFARLKSELDHLVGRRAARARRDGRVGGRQRRPLRERRLHLRQEAAARDRPPHPLSGQPPRRRGGRRSRGASRRRRRRSGLLRRDRHRAQRQRASERTVSIVGDRRDRHRARLHKLGVADGTRVAEGARRRHGHAAHARRRRGARGAVGALRALATGARVGELRPTVRTG